MEYTVTQDEIGTHLDCEHPGVRGRSTDIGLRNKETHADGKVWAKHCAQEVGNWDVFLPQLFKLWTVVKNTDYNPFTDLSVEGKGADLKYKYITT